MRPASSEQQPRRNARHTHKTFEQWNWNKLPPAMNERTPESANQQGKITNEKNRRSCGDERATAETAE